MMDFNERVIPGISANYLYKEATARYEFAKKFIKRRTRVLDIGCGTGYGSASLAEKAEVIGIDYDKETVFFAKKHYGNKVSFQLGDAHALKFDDCEFDVVCAFELIEHLENPNSFLKEAKRVLIKGGKLVLSTPNKDIHSPDKKSASQYHLKEYRLSEFKKLLNKHFQRIEIRNQHKSRRAREALEDFMKSQEARQNFVNRDRLGLRKFLPRFFKEKIWKISGVLFGRAPQSKLETRDFPIVSGQVDKAEYFVAICQK